MQKITRTTANGVVPKKRPISIFVEVQTIITEAKYLLDISSGKHFYVNGFIFMTRKA